MKGNYPETRSYTDTKYCPSELEKGSEHSKVFKSICEGTSSGCIPPTPVGVRSKNVLWNGRCLWNYLKHKTGNNLDNYKRELAQNGSSWRTVNKIASQGCGAELAEIVFCTAAQICGEELKDFIEGYIEFCLAKESVESVRPLAAYPDLIKEIESRLKTPYESQPTPYQPRLTIPEAKENNDNYYANETLPIVGRERQQERLRNFLNCDLNVAWFQLAGDAGQGKSRLALDLMHDAIGNHGWAAGFLEENDFNFFEHDWKSWQPDKPHLLIFDYVVGREHKIKPIIQTLCYRRCDFEHHHVRIFLVERQPWNHGNSTSKKNKNDKSFSSSTELDSYAEWFINLCQENTYDGIDPNLELSRFKSGVEELNALSANDLTGLVKQISEKTCDTELLISNEEIEQTLHRIDQEGRPLYAYFLGQELAHNVSGFESWTNAKVLTNVLQREMITRWHGVFNDRPPCLGDDHLAMNIAVLANIVREVKFEDTLIKTYFGNIDSKVRKQALIITNNALTKSGKSPSKVNALEPDLLGEWLALYCFEQGLKFEGLLDIAWQYSPEQTAVFLKRVSQDFFSHSKTLAMLGHKPFNYGDEACTLALGNVATDILSKLYLNHSDFPDITITEQGICYPENEPIDQDKQNTIGLYTYAVEENFHDSTIKLGLSYRDGLVSRQDWQDAVDRYLQLVEEDNPEAAFYIARCFESDQNWKEAIDLYQNALDAGHSSAVNFLNDALLVQNFLKEDDCHLQGSKDWFKLQYKDLKGSPTFDPPIVTGDWQAAEMRDMTFYLSKLEKSFEIMRLSKRIEGYVCLDMRRLFLPFYPGCHLLDVQLYSPVNKDTLIFSAIASQKGVVLLNGESNIIHGLNRHLLFLDDEKLVEGYLQFFCSYIGGEPYRIITDISQISFDKKLNKSELEKIKNSFFVPKRLQGSFKTEGWQGFEVCMLYRNALFKARFKVFSDGMVYLENDEYITDNLPIIQYEYDGIFRVPLKPNAHA